MPDDADVHPLGLHPQPVRYQHMGAYRVWLLKPLWRDHFTPLRNYRTNSDLPV
jgi:hypothetical protein